MGQSYYGVSHAALPNGGGFTTPDWEREQDVFTATVPVLSASLSSSVSASAAEHNMHSTAWDLLYAISGNATVMTAVGAQLGAPFSSSIGTYVVWASSTANL